MPPLLALALWLAPPLTDAQIKAYLPAVHEPANLTPAEGQHLHDLAVKLSAKRVLEIGTSGGYSALWLAMAVRKTNGKLITVEIHEARHAAAREHFNRTGLAPFIDPRLADAVTEVPALAGPFDLVFLDAAKNDYLFYLEQLLPKLRPGGIIAAHNVKSRAADLAAYLDRIRTDPALRTEFFPASPQGLAITYKK